MAPRSAACLFGVGCSCALTGRGSRHRQRCAIAAGCEALRKAGLGGRPCRHSSRCRRLWHHAPSSGWYETDAGRQQGEPKRPVRMPWSKTAVPTAAGAGPHAQRRGASEASRRHAVCRMAMPRWRVGRIDASAAWPSYAASTRWKVKPVCSERPASGAGRVGHSAGASAAELALAVARTGARKRLSRIALPSTKTLDSDIAPAASIGDRSVPLKG